ncbi:MAG: anaerobic ribonucleoside-triphosphate reductase activating protein [Betaproteobacteria bacterium]|nr:anaerobic ribonucleoside-triphosphate reductase activating protein [Betaproteobacteria bacterium]
MNALAIGGITPLSTTDYPGRLAAVVFCQGCAWHCRYCHNTHLIPRRVENVLRWSAARGFLERRRGLLDAVVFSGGEPTLQARLPDALADARAMGFKVGLHTAGSYPVKLAAALPLVDWVGMDVKAPFDCYDRVTQARGSGRRARESAELLIGSGVDHEFRTTVHPALLGAEDLLGLADSLAALGATRFVLQEFRPTGCRDTELLDSTERFTPGEGLLAALGSRFADFTVRRA